MGEAQKPLIFNSKKQIIWDTSQCLYWALNLKMENEPCFNRITLRRLLYLQVPDSLMGHSQVGKCIIIGILCFSLLLQVTLVQSLAQQLHPEALTQVKY